MATLKTAPTNANVSRFLARVPDERRREDCRVVQRLMQRVTRARPRMWGASIVGFGRYHYRYPSGREGDWFLTGFSPRKQDLTIYLMAGFTGRAALLRRLGKHRAGGSCLYIKRLADVNLRVLETLVRRSVAHLKRAHG
jgi:hypothetical protein